MRTKLLSLICVLLVAALYIIVLQSSESVIAGPPEPEAAFLKAKKLQLELSNDERVFITDPKLVEVGDNVFVAGNDVQFPKKIRYFSLRHIVEIVGYPAVSEPTE
ncbi:hypothetical protein SAMN06265222_1521 [Neorhodopirellula lusitana]|uniref:Uncharacterized protein n=1 Tax=Neorhodopirellula lusitana TaxID=445327 RepID=A0ABY1QUD5_9BACT|nr:hypothetical protein [Neorhodopirellula lusitana]SMP80391.1 hypothetical protein SAMN06265222_1521 [Neorhodopirellula lusitana]